MARALPYKKPKRLKDCLNISDLRELARHRLPRPIFHYLDGGSEDEETLRRNTTAFESIRLVPRCLVDVSEVKTATRVLGCNLQWPVFCAPTGGSRSYHPEGELAVARAAAQAGTLYSLSTLATYSIEEVAAASAGPKLFQLYIFKDRDLTRELIRRCKQARYDALCITVDAAVRGNRERELRAGMGALPLFSLSNLIEFAVHPRWALSLLRTQPIDLPNIAQSSSKDGLAAKSRFVGAQLNPAISWNDVREMIDLWDGPFAIKGVMSPEDARRAADIGATAIIVSNHGGRQLDGAAGAVDALPDIVAAVGGRLEVILDGGIRRGAHVLKALALGATACSVGRPYLYGLGAGGEAGVVHALHILRTELIRAMQLCGCADVRALEASLVQR